MEFLPALMWIGIVLAVVPALYALHRFCLWLEGRGLLFYWHRKPDSSAASCFVAVQKAFEPQAQHATQVKEQQRRQAGDPGGRCNPDDGQDN